MNTHGQTLVAKYNTNSLNICMYKKERKIGKPVYLGILRHFVVTKEGMGDLLGVIGEFYVLTVLCLGDTLVQ